MSPLSSPSSLEKETLQDAECHNRKRVQPNSVAWGDFLPVTSKIRLQESCLRRLGIVLTALF